VLAALRWIRSDVRARAAQAVVAVLVVAGVVTALLLSATLLEGATNPWRGLFAQTHGAQIWLRLAPGTDVAPLARISGVIAVAGPYATAAATLVQGPAQAPVQLRAMTPAMPSVGRPLVRQGVWLRASDPSGVVLEASFAQAVRAVAGTRLVIDGLDGSSVRLRVVGIADTSDQGFYPNQTPGLVWVLPGLFRRVEPIARHTEEAVGLRVSDPGAAGLIVQQAVTELGAGNLVSVTTWTQVEQSMARGDPLAGLLLALFGLVALGAAVIAIANATGARVLVQLEDLATLKMLGFSPAQVISVVLAENAALGAAGTAAGLVTARLLAGPLLQGIPPSVVPALAPLPAGWVALIAGGTELAVIVAAAVPGWRAGRIQPVSAVRHAPPSGHLSRLARAALLSRLPPAVVLGTRAAFLRRLPAALTVGGLTVSMAMITIGLGFAATVDDVQHHPADIGLAAALTVSPGQLSAAQARSMIASDRDVEAAYPSVRVDALLPGETTTITTLGMGTSARPYPFRVAQGRIYRAPGEAVASQGLLDALHLQVGELVRMAIGGVPVIFRIVGRIIEPEYGGQVLGYGIDTLSQAGAAMPPVSYSLVLRGGVTADAAAAHLLVTSGGRLGVAEIADPASQLGAVRMMLAGVIVVLALIGLTSLFTASAVGLRDQLRDASALRAMGLTPLQVMIALVTSTSVLTLVAVAAGAAAGLSLSSRLINLAAQAYGIGAGIGRPPSAAAMAVAIAAAVAVSGLTAMIPARRVTRMPVAAALGP
jgi:putative ABC transport system permease protein